MKKGFLAIRRSPLDARAACVCLTEKADGYFQNVFPDYEKMSASSRLMMKLFVKMLKAKKDKTESELEMIRMISASYDISDKKYIEPILDCLQKQH